MDHESGENLVVVQRRVRAKLSIELRLERLRGELGSQLSHRIRKCRDDRPGRGPADEALSPNRAVIKVSKACKN
jgi:hypothetical protein